MTAIMQAQLRSARILILVLALLVSIPASSGPDVGEIAPPLRVEALTPHPVAGDENPLKTLSGEYVYLDFWASWCPPCRIGFGELEALHKDLEPLGLRILAINVDEDREDAMTFLQAHPVTYPVVRDKDFSTTARYEPGPLPVGYLVDKQGHIVLIHRGFKPGDGARLRALIEPLL